jgi:large subunit ribosomal protein L13
LEEFLEMKTTWKRKSDIERKWYTVDLEGQTLGRAASQIASLLIGKGKVDRVPNMDCGDHVIVLNSDLIEVTGKKMSDKIYYTHSNYPGGLKSETLAQLMERDSTKVIWNAVYNMLPQSKLKDTMIRRLYVYKGSEHKHEAQKPEKFELTS